VLFVGESPPSGPTFFYQANSRLFVAMKAAFEQAYDRPFPSDAAFLYFFQESGCFLDDLCRVPVNGLPRPLRRQACRDAVPDLARRIECDRPRAVVPVARSLQRHVDLAVQAAGLALLVLPATPFPAFGHGPESVRCLAEHLRMLRRLGVLPTGHW